ncbi:MAG: endonuclease/exonuclease/phosphatase family protein [Verrucomicrobiota bacterium]|jgi:endonuclease/exonuclease/phosphatase family metal-dependent hydrolase
MAKFALACVRLVVLPLFLLCPRPAFAGVFRVATYNVENYLDQPTDSRPQVKSAEARAQVRASIHALNPDVIALEEMGGVGALMELRASLKAEGMDFPDWELASGADTNVHVAVLSRLPIVARRPHTNDVYLLDGHSFRVRRGFVEVDIQVDTNFTFTLLAAHLKSRLPVPEADEAEQRAREAQILRRIVEQRLARQPQARLVVLGDFNDLKDSDAVREIVGRGRFKLMDTRPAERNGREPAAGSSRAGPRSVTWTYYYDREDRYDRVDYIFLSPAMAGYWLPDETCIPVMPNWGVASDHRPIVAAFKTGGE